MEYEHIVELVREVSKAGLSHFEYSEGNIHISMGCKPVESVMEVPSVQTIPQPETSAVSAVIPETAADAVPEKEGAAATVISQENLQVVTSPLVGTFYSAPAEGAENYVKIGDRVKKGQTLAIVEAMKLMNEIESDFDGVVTEILVENESPVEFGQPLFKIAQ